MKSKALNLRPQDRQRILEAQRKLKMARSAHAYVRGNTVRFYEWLETAKTGTIPEGPAVWICGDCHLGNLGPVADADGRVEIEIRDLDQTVIGNPAHDLIRLALSLATAARGSDLPGVTTAHMLEHMMEGYEKSLQKPAAGKSNSGKIAEPIRIALRQALKRKWRHLAEERIEDVRPQIPLGKRFWALTKEEKAAISEIFQTKTAHKLVTSLRQRDDDAKVEIIDAAYWMKGCSSLGRLRFAVLLEVAKGKNHDSDFCLFDIKEAVKAAAPHSVKASMPRDYALRVVTGARALSPYLGERMLPAKLLNRSVVVRELLPQDLKLELDRLTREEAVAAARFLAAVVGRAHARQMDPSTRRLWRADLNRNRGKGLDAPSWLWRSVVELAASHESAYLEHCRRYALESV